MGWVSCWTNRVFAVGLAAAVAFLMLGCSKEDWIPPKKDPVYKAELTNTDQGLVIHKLNDFAWTNVVFTLNKEYIFSVTEVRAGQFKFIIDFESFHHKDTGEPFNPVGIPAEERVGRVWIEGDEGYWY